MVRIVVTGFEPFGEWPMNSSGEAVRLLRGVSTHVLPVDHGLAAERVREIARAEKPDAMLLTGLARGAAFRLETVARGPGPCGVSRLRAGRWDFAGAQAALSAHGQPARVSRNAGRFVCETTYFAALGERVPQVAFLHVPPLGGTWTAERIARGIGVVLEAAWTRQAMC